MALVDLALQFITGARAEIAIFVIAICAHAVLFGKYSIYPKLAQRGKLLEVSKVGAPARAGGAGPSQRNAALSSSADNGAGTVLARALQPLLNQGSDKAAFSQEIEGRLKRCPASNVNETLAATLAAVGKAATTELLAAVQEALGSRGLVPAGRMTEMLLKGYLNLKLSEEFDKVLAAAEANGPAPSAVVCIALRSCVLAGDLEASFVRLRELAEPWRVQYAATAAAPQQLMRQLARLAADKEELPRLIKELEATELLAPWTLEALLAECARRGDLPALKDVEQLGRELGLQLTSGAHLALFRGAASAEEQVHILDEAGNVGLASKGLLLAAAEAAAANDDGNLAQAVMRHLPSDPTPELAAVLLRLAATGPLAGADPEGALIDMYENHLIGVDLACDPRAERLVVEAALKKKRPEVLTHIMAAIPDGARQVTLLKSFSTEQRLQDVFGIFRACNEKSSCLYNALIDACIDCGDLAGAEKAMKEATAGGLADVVTYNTIIKAHLQQGDSRRARAAIEAMRSAGLSPNCVTFNELIDAVIKTNVQGAWGLIEEMKSCGLKPNHVTCSILLKSIQKGSRPVDVERALAVVDATRDEVDEVLLSSVCEACIRAGRGDLLAKQLQKQCGPSGIQVRGAHTFGSLIRAYGYLNNLTGVWDTWREMRTRHVVPTCITLGCMVEALASNGDPEAAYEVIREAMNDPQTRPLVNAVIYCSVLKGFSHQKQFDRVWLVYEEMLSEKMQFSIVTFNTLIDACARSGEMARIEPLLQDMTKQKIEPNIITYSTVLKGYCQENRLDKAFELLDEMKKSTALRPDEITYNTLLDGCARYGLFERGLAVVAEMEEAGVVPSNFTLSVLVKLATRSRKPTKAFELCDQLAKKYSIRLNSHVYNNLMHACTSYKDNQKAMEVFVQMLRDRTRPDLRSYSLVLRAFVSSGSAQDAAGLLRAAMGLRGAHPSLAGFDTSLVQLRGGLPSDLVVEVLEGIAGQCNDERLAAELLRDLQNVPGLRLDSKLPRLMSKAPQVPGRR